MSFLITAFIFLVVVPIVLLLIINLIGWLVDNTDKYTWIYILGVILVIYLWYEFK